MTDQTSPQANDTATDAAFRVYQRMLHNVETLTVVEMASIIRAHLPASAPPSEPTAASTRTMAGMAADIAEDLMQCRFPMEVTKEELTEHLRLILWYYDRPSAPIPPSVNGELLAALKEIVGAMHDYQLDVDDYPPRKHKDMMVRAYAAISRAESQSESKTPTNDSQTPLPLTGDAQAGVQAVAMDSTNINRELLAACKIAVLFYESNADAVSARKMHKVAKLAVTHAEAMQNDPQKKLYPQKSQAGDFGVPTQQVIAELRTAGGDAWDNVKDVDALLGRESQPPAPNPPAQSDGLVGKIRAVLNSRPVGVKFGGTLGAFRQWQIEEIAHLLDAPQPASAKGSEGLVYCKKKYSETYPCVVCGQTCCDDEDCMVHPGSCELSNSKGWVCSRHCWDKYADQFDAPSPSPTPASLPDNIVVPQGWRWTGEVRKPKCGEFFLVGVRVARTAMEFAALNHVEFPIVVRDDAGASEQPNEGDTHVG